MRTARSRTSGEKRLDLLIAPSSQRLEPPQNSGRFILSLCTFIVGVANLVSDIFNIYWEALPSPTPAFTVMLLVRVAALWLVFINLRNASSLPEGMDRFNILLPFRKSSLS